MCGGGEVSPWLQPRLGLPHTPTAGLRRRPATPCLSSRPCAGITTPDLNRFIKMFAPRAISHANKITLFHCLLSKTPLSAKKYERDSGFKTLIAGTCKNQVLRKPCDCESLRPSRTVGIVLNSRGMLFSYVIASVAWQSRPYCHLGLSSGVTFYPFNNYIIC